ncbi:DUF4377 domain-containing protein [Psychrobacter sp. I-STPA10]|uniref:DUF4377 domain-containing protein n=1 Tax=Psychrobacter sp. I-STPA10 TaxID=2585769 RepID=UPI001E32F82C|nr:DUF4377 domain-containing protein [Psychrobacter sp. I-STPA10]
MNHLTTKRVPQPRSILGVILVSSMILTGLTGCQSTLFKDEPVPEPIYVPQLSLGDSQVLTILAGRVPCDTALPMQCLLAKQQGSTELFQIPYNWIEGFTPASNVEYTISASPMIDNNLLDNETQGLTGHWVLNNIIDQRLFRVQ